MSTNPKELNPLEASKTLIEKSKRRMIAADIEAALDYCGERLAARNVVLTVG